MTIDNEQTVSADPAARSTGSPPADFPPNPCQSAEDEVAVLETQDGTSLAPDETERLLHELRVHQVEFERQNDRLRCAQQQLEISHARYFDLYNLAPVGYISLSEQGLILQANLAATSLLGVPRSQLIKQSLTHFIVPENQDAYCQHRRQTLDTAQPQACELRMVRPDGTRFWARLEATAGHDVECQTPISRVTLSEITAWKEAEESLRWDAAVTQSLSDLYRPLILPVASLAAIAQAVLEQALLLTGSEHGFVSVIDPATGEHVAHTFTERFPNTSRGPNEDQCIVFPRGIDGGYRGLWGAALNARHGFFTNSPAAHPTAIGVPPGHLPLRQLLAVPVLLGQELVGQIALANPGREYTERDVQAVQRLGEFYALGIQRQRDEEQLIQARDAAETASHRKSQFLANMSYEIRTPMTAILGFSELLRTTERTRSDQDEFLQLIQSNGAVLLRLIDDILELSRIEADKLRINRISCQLEPILDEVLAVAKLRAAEKGIGLQFVCRLPPPGTIRTDPIRLRQILVNLVGNAVKFTDHGEVNLTVQALAEGARLQFTVTDTGIGIPAEEFHELFQPFGQVNGSRTRRYGGIDLGLVISQRLAHALGGQIDVASEIGRGSTFTLTIDAGLPEDARVPPPPQALSRGEGASPNDPPVRELHGSVLLVEDSTDCQMVVRFLLKMWKLDVDLAGDGQMACDMAERSRADGRPYDLILMDIQLPRLNGFESTRRLRQQGWLGPIVALTAYAMAGDREECLRAGCDDYLSKPISMNAFQTMLQQYLS